MNFERWWTVLQSLAVVTGLLVPSLTAAPPATGTRAMVASVHPLATEAGLAALRRGGNAVDAAVATALTLGVVDNHNSGIGGGCFILLRRPDGTVVALDGRETAPARAHRDMYLRDGKAQPELSRTGPLAVAVPGALAAYAQAIREHGQLPLADLLKPAADIAERGFAIDRVYARNLRGSQNELRQFPGSAALLLRADGSPLEEGDTLRQPDLARVYRAVAEQGIDWFYRGPFAERVGQWMSDHGGLVTAADFAAYRPLAREPLVTRYRGHQIVGFPPPSSGGVHVAQILHILEPFDLQALHEQDPALFVHVVAEAMKIAFADRAHWLGDPGFADVPRGLVDPAYGRTLARGIDLDQATAVRQHGLPPAAEPEFFGKHTTHIAAADADGNWVAITATVNTSFGSKVIVPGTGVMLNNEMDDFSLQPGVPNAFGLIGAEANAVEPGKRPLSSMSPTLVLNDSGPVMTLGAAGGPTIISQVVLAILRRIDLQLPLEEAVARPRFHHQWSPDTLTVEAGFSERVTESLKQRGHSITRRDALGVTQAIEWSGADRKFLGVHDPRVPGRAAGL